MSNMRQFASTSHSNANILGNLKPAPGSRTKRKRVARGSSSGRGGTSGRGQKGQNSRSGGGVRIGFEGGQTPLMRTMPKIGFTNSHRKEMTTVPLWKLASWIEQGRLKVKEGKQITMKELLRSGVVHSVKEGGVKLLGDPEHMPSTKLPPLNIVVSKASTSAIKAIEAAGGKIECRYHNALGLRAVLRPGSFARKGLALPQQALPTKRSDIEFYSNPAKRGYLAQGIPPTTQSATSQQVVSSK